MQSRRGQLGISGAILILLCTIQAFAGSEVNQSASAFPGSGWNTWDIERPNAMIYMPDGIVVELTIYDPQTGKSFGHPGLKEVERFGAHAPNGSYSLARYQQGGLSYEVEFATWEGNLLAHARALSQTKYALVADFSFYFGRTGTIERKGANFVVSGKSARFFATAPSAGIAQPGVSPEHSMTWDLGGDRWISLTTTPQPPDSEAGYRKRMDTLREEYAKARVRSDGFLGDGAQAASDVAAWNVVWNPRRNMPVTTVAREFPLGSGVTWGGYIQGCWDAVFQSILADLQSTQMADASLRGLFADTTSSGLLTGGTGFGIGEDHSQPPLAAYALLKLYKSHPNQQKLLEDSFSVLYRWHEWWPAARDGNHNGLLEWGSNPVSGPDDDEYHQKVADILTAWYKRNGSQAPPFKKSDFMDNLTAAGWESGMDNSPMWDGVIFNPQTHTMEQEDVGLNSFFVLDAWALAEIAHIIGRNSEEEKLRRESAEMGDRINQMMWSEEDGLYLNRKWDGTFNRRISTTNFYPMLAGIASPDRAQRMVQHYLLNPQKFWGEYVIPTTPRDDPAFGDNNYWRGRIWAPTNYLVYEGLKRSGMDEVAAEVAEKSTQLFLKEHGEKGHAHENYNGANGVGDDVKSSVTYYGWSGILPLMMVEELIDVEPWGSGMRFGSIVDKTTSVRNVRIMNDTYDVFLGPGLRVMRNGQKFIESDHPVLLRNVRWTEDQVHFDISAKASSKLTLSGFRENEKIRSTLPSEQRLTTKQGHVEITVAPETKTVDLRRGNP